jgi:hypothetical protein
MRALEAEEKVAGLERDVVAHIAGGMQAIQRAVADDRHYVLVPMWWPMKQVQTVSYQKREVYDSRFGVAWGAHIAQHRVGADVAGQVTTTRGSNAV